MRTMWRTRRNSRPSDDFLACTLLSFAKSRSCKSSCPTLSCHVPVMKALWPLKDGVVDTARYLKAVSASASCSGRLLPRFLSIKHAYRVHRRRRPPFLRVRSPLIERFFRSSTPCCVFVSGMWCMALFAIKGGLRRFRVWASRVQLLA